LIKEESFELGSGISVHYEDDKDAIAKFYSGSDKAPKSGGSGKSKFSLDKFD
jgi:hypothetical protein